MYINSGWNLNMILPVLRIRDVYPGSRILIFTHPGSKNSNKREVWKKFIVIPFFVATNFTKSHIILFFYCWKRIELFTQKVVTKLSKIWALDPGSGKNPIPDPGSRGQKGTASRIPDPDRQHFFLFRYRYCRSQKLTYIVVRYGVVARVYLCRNLWENIMKSRESILDKMRQK
jgi:hypothetical protein